MFTISAAGLTKALTVVTISLHSAAAHQAAAHHAPAHHATAHYTVRSGDTLSDIARHEYGSPADWPALWWINRHTGAQPAGHHGPPAAAAQHLAPAPDLA